MNQDDRVLASLDYFIEITNRAMFDCRRQRPIMPNRFVAFEKEAANEIRGGQIFMTRYGDQRAVQPPGHVLDKAPQISQLLCRRANNKAPAGLCVFRLLVLRWLDQWA